MICFILLLLQAFNTDSVPTVLTWRAFEGLELQSGIKSKDIKVYVSDDVKSAQKLGKLWKCELQIMLPNTTESDEIDIL